ncbi:hypothetical protein F4780DRAFT_207207 [Xylariomycetidae sp. FL0641]|nr:hypothetical protein F4780DRAFT_207207 [Xylariomycetidae sp. FL0641]
MELSIKVLTKASPSRPRPTCEPDLRRRLLPSYLQRNCPCKAAIGRTVGWSKVRNGHRNPTITHRERERESSMEDSYHSHEAMYFETSHDPPDYAATPIESYSHAAGASAAAVANRPDFDQACFRLTGPSTDDSTIAPVSLDLLFTSHDDTCLERCLGTYHGPAPHRGNPIPPFNPRPRFATASLSIDHSSLDPLLDPHPPTVQHNYANVRHSLQLTATHDIPYGEPFGYQENLANPFTSADYDNHHLYTQMQVGTPHFPMEQPQFLVGQPHFPLAHPHSPAEYSHDLEDLEDLMADDAASVAGSSVSCSSDCCLDAACDEPTCAVDGTPCDDDSCLFPGPNPQQEISATGLQTSLEHQPSGDRRASIPSGANPVPSHTDCTGNHTLADHDAAATLRDLQTKDGRTAEPVLALQGSILEAGFKAQPPTPGRTPQPSSEETACVCQWNLVCAATGIPIRTCGMVFGSSLELHNHVSKDHVDPMTSKTKSSYICLWAGCGRDTSVKFQSRNKLRRHVGSHTAYKPFECPTCGQCFSAQQALDQHVRIHTGDMPFECDFPGCQKRFRQKSALTMHKRTHTGEKPLKCSECGMAFAESSNLSKHRKTHRHELKHVCPEPGCAKGFLRLDQLRRHQRTHARSKETGGEIRPPASLTTTDSLSTSENPASPLSLNSLDLPDTMF